MNNRVFFSFHYQDVIEFRANVVRQHKIVKGSTSGYIDSSIWEKNLKTNPLAIKRLINSETRNSSVTAVLIGTETYKRPWVRYEIFKSFDKKNKILGIHINRIGGNKFIKKVKGKNPFNFIGIAKTDRNKLIYCELKNNIWYEFIKLKASRSIPSLLLKEKPYTVVTFDKLFKTYDWIANNGYLYFNRWVTLAKSY